MKWVKRKFDLLTIQADEGIEYGLKCIMKFSMNLYHQLSNFMFEIVVSLVKANVIEFNSITKALSTVAQLSYANSLIS